MMVILQYVTNMKVTYFNASPGLNENHLHLKPIHLYVAANVAQFEALLLKEISKGSNENITCCEVDGLVCLEWSFPDQG